MLEGLKTIRHLLTVTIIATALISIGLGAGLTYALIKTNPTLPLSFQDESEDATPSADYVIFEKRETLAERPNNFNKIKISGYGITSDGTKHLIYAFTYDPLNNTASQRYLIPTGHITKDRRIYLSGVGDKDFTVLSLFGDNLTDDYDFIKRKNFPLTQYVQQPSLNNVLYPDYDRIIILNKETGNVSSFSSDEFDGVDLSFIGLSGNPEMLYVSQNYQKDIFKVNIPEKRAYKFKSLDGALDGSLRVCPRQDYALFISRAINPEINQSLPPYGIKMIDLTDDTVVKIIENLTVPPEDLRVSCASGKIIFRGDKGWKIFNLEGKEYGNKIFEDEGVFLFLNDGKYMVVNSAGSLKLKNYKSGREVILGSDSEGVQYGVIGVISD